MKYSRVLGCNIEKLMLDKQVDKNQFAMEMNYSIVDVNKILEGRLTLTPPDLHDIAEVLEVPVESIILEPIDGNYNTAIDCMGHFENLDNQEVVLDIIDMYIDLRESI